MNSIDRTSRSLPSRLLLPLLTAVVSTVLLLVLFVPQARADFLDVENIGTVNFGTWANAGSLSITTTLCIASATNASASGGTRDRTLPYDVSVFNEGDPAAYYLYLDGDSSRTGNQRIAMAFAHRDRLAGNGFEFLSPGQFDQQENSGQYRLCQIGVGGNNADLRTDIPLAGLETAASGYYEGSFRLVARNRSDEIGVIFTVSLSVQGSSEVRISGLEDVSFGVFDGLSDRVAQEAFCIYSNAGSYRLTISGSHQQGDSFFVADPVGGDQIPMALAFADNGVGPGTTAVGAAPLSGVGHDQTGCNGGNNATLTMTLLEADLRQASSGFYSESLQLLVEPE